MAQGHIPQYNSLMGVRLFLDLIFLKVHDGGRKGEENAAASTVLVPQRLQGVAGSMSCAFSVQPSQAGGCRAHGAGYARVARPAAMVSPAETPQQEEQERQGRALA